MEVLGRKDFVLKESQISKELAPAARQVDLVWRILTPRGAEALLHIELQLEPDEAMGQRMLEYGMRLYERDHLPILSVVIFLQRTSTLPTPPFIIDLDGEELVRYRYFVIRLWEVPQERILEKPYPVLWPLVGLMAGATPDNVAAIGQQIADIQEIKTPLKEELVGYLGLLAGIQLGNAEVRAALRRHPMVNELWQHSSVAQALKEEGREEGRAEGRAEATHDLARLALEGRFGELSTDLLEALGRADEATLRELIKRVARDSLEQIRTLLGLAGTSQG
jgi:predicted transposase/invertase (TIGR01784 family)